MDLKTAFEDLISQWELAAPKRMFGYDVYAANRKMFAWIQGDGIVLTALSTADIANVREQFGAGPYHHVDRVFHTWMHVLVPDQKTFDRLVPFLRASYEGAYEKSLEPQPEKRSRSGRKSRGC